MTKIALLIGVSEYEPGLSPLPAAVKDIAAMQRVLLNPEMGGFDEANLLPNPDSQIMQYEIETLFSRCTRDDLVLLFFSGHGIKDDRGRLYFASRVTRKNAKGDLIRSTAVPASFIHDIMNNNRCRRQAIILDCCFSGAFDPAFQAKADASIDLRSQLGAEGRVVLTSSSTTEYSFEQPGVDLSIYTRYLVEGIETGAGDLDEDGFVSVLELHEYATSKVQETAPKMTPKLIVMKDKGFEIVLAKAHTTDPKLKYRKMAARYANVGTIRPAGQAMLKTLRQQLGLTTDETAEIEAEVLRPYQERLTNLQQYRETLIAEAEHEYPLSEFACEDLHTFQQMLGLRDEDVLPIQRAIEGQFTPQSAIHQQNLVQHEQGLTDSVQKGIVTQTQRKAEEETKHGTLYLRILGTSYAYKLPNNLESISIGRQRRKPNSPSSDYGNDIVIRVPNSDQESLKISRRHLEIKRIGSEYLVLDKSGGRTKINGRLIQDTESHVLKAQDRLQIADVLELEVLMEIELAALEVNKVVEVHQSGEPQPNLIIEASLGDIVTMNETSISDVSTVWS